MALGRYAGAFGYYIKHVLIKRREVSKSLRSISGSSGGDSAAGKEGVLTAAALVGLMNCASESMDSNVDNSSNDDGSATNQANAVARTVSALYNALALDLEAADRLGEVSPSITDSSNSSRAHEDNCRDSGVTVGRDLTNVQETLGAPHAAQHLHGLNGALMVYLDTT